MDLLKVSNLNAIYNMWPPYSMEELFIMANSTDMNSPFFRSNYQFRGLILLFCDTGTLDIRVNGIACSLKQGAILMILPEMMVQPIGHSVDFKSTTFAMSYDFIEKFTILPELISNIEVTNSPVTYSSNMGNEIIREVTQLIIKYYSLPKTLSLNNMIQYLMFALITAISSCYMSLTKKENLQRNRIKDITDSFFELLNEYGYQERNTSFYAEKLHMTTQHLSAVVKKKTGKSVKSWIGFAVINKAKEYLNTTSLSVKEISYKMDFADASLFCRYFKRYIGQTPNEYRNQ
ncbi:MAG: helix-turn-helix domain-containing protein [Sphingobacterium sp.]|nr:helix-turn-helix domain-containing protein [Sphingobacterium sp.]